MGDTPSALTVGAVIKLKREERGVSRRRLSLAAGLSDSYVGKIESGTTEPSFRAFSQIAVTLGFKAGELLTLVRAEALRALDSEDAADG